MPTKPKTVKVGDTIDLDGAASMMRLPDGVVVTCRAQYVARHPGRHVLITSAAGGTATETPIEVTE